MKRLAFSQNQCFSSLPHAIFIIVFMKLENIGGKIYCVAYKICVVLVVKLQIVFERRFVGKWKLSGN